MITVHRKGQSTSGDSKVDRGYTRPQMVASAGISGGVAVLALGGGTPGISGTGGAQIVDSDTGTVWGFLNGAWRNTGITWPTALFLALFLMCSSALGGSVAKFTGNVVGKTVTSTNLMVTNTGPVSTSWNPARDFTVFGNLEVFPKSVISYYEPDPFGMMTGPYTIGGGVYTMGFMFGFQSEYEAGDLQSKYAIAGGRNYNEGTQNLTFNVKNRYTVGGASPIPGDAWLPSGLGGWFEFDFNDAAVMAIWANGGMSLDQPDTRNHPNTFNADIYTKGPGTNSFSVRSNIISRYGSIIFTNGGAWMMPMTKAQGHALTNAFGVFAASAAGWMYLQTDATAGIHYFDGANWKLISTTTDN